MKVNLNTLSKRAQEVLSSPRFLLDDSSKKASFAVECAGDKILTARHKSSLEDVSFLFAEVLCLFSQGKNILEVWKISYREVESFLRDENHLPFLPVDPKELESLFIKTKLSLMGALLKSSHQFNLVDVSQWEALSLVEKNKLAQALFSALSWDFIYCDGKTMQVSGAYEGFTSELATGLLTAIFKADGKDLPMIVVAVQ